MAAEAARRAVARGAAAPLGGGTVAAAVAVAATARPKPQPQPQPQPQTAAVRAAATAATAAAVGGEGEGGEDLPPARATIWARNARRSRSRRGPGGKR